MAGALMTVTTGTGGITATVAAVGLCLSIGAGNGLDPALLTLLVAGVMVLVIGFVLNFEHRSRLWAAETEAQLQSRRRDLQSLGIIPGH